MAIINCRFGRSCQGSTTHTEDIQPSDTIHRQLRTDHPTYHLDRKPTVHRTWGNSTRLQRVER